jgi:hypothetical protein
MTKTDIRTSISSGPSAARLVGAFIAGFLGVVIFHQGMLALLHGIGLTTAVPWQTDPTAPFGVPKIWSIAFWGGLWGIVFAFLEPHLPRGGGYFLGALLFGAIFPTLVAWFVVAPMKGLPIAGGWQASSIATALLVNGAWGLGTALLLRGGDMIVDSRRPAA